MAHSKGNAPSSGDYNTFVGTSPITTAYASAVAATQKVAALLGVGYGDRGYGQTTPVLNTPMVSGQRILASDWANLRTAIANMATFQGTAVTLLPPASDFVSGAAVKAEVPATTAYDLPTMIANIDAQRLAANGGASLSVTNGAYTNTRSVAWGSGSNSIICEFTASFPSEDAARYFFNSNGAITLVLAHPVTSTTQDSNWNSVLSTLGTITINHHTTNRSGSGGTPQTAMGFYELTATYQTLFSGALGTGAYTANTVLVEGAVSSVAGVNGGNGTTVKIRVTLTDGHTNSFSDSVASGTNLSVGYLKAATVLTGISSPTFTNVTNFG